MFGAFFVRKGDFMKLSNETEIIAKPYCEEDAQEIVRLIGRNVEILRKSM